MNETDVMVVGAGLAGLECAEGLARAGLRVILVDAKADVKTGVRTTGIFVRKTLEDFLLPADCLGPAVRRVALHGPRGPLLSLESPHDEFRVGRMARLYQRGLDRCLAKGVDFRASTRLVAIDEARDGSIVTLARGGRTTRVAAKYVIGADGARSRVAAALGLDQNHEWIVGVEDVYGGVRSADTPVFHCFLDARLAPGYLAWIVDDGEEIHVGVGGYAHMFQPRAALAELLQRARAFVDLDRGVHLERRGGRIPVNGVLPRLVCPRGLLVAHGRRDRPALPRDT
jgi:flavin-dependent dehydrogenase